MAEVARGAQRLLAGQTSFPDGNYFIATSRLRPGLDGGYTVAMMRRALQYAEFGGVQPQLLTFDFWPDHEPFRREFIDIGLATENTIIRNLYVELREAPQLLRDAARANGIIEPAPSAPVSETTDSDARGIPWRTTATNSTGVIVHTDFLDLEGKPLFRLPFIAGRADWWRAPILIDVFGDDGSVVGQLRGFAELYQVWMNHVVATAPPRPSVVIVEARQVGEMLVGARDYALVHTVHNAHTVAPHDWDSPMDETWSGWFDTLDGYDAIIWLTSRQRDDAERRFGKHARSVVIAHPAEPLDALPPFANRDPNRAVMVARLAEQKRVRHAIQAWPIVLGHNPRATLDVYGDGVQRPMLEALIAELGLESRVTLHGYRPDAAEQTATAALLIVSSNYEGQGLVVLEAFSRGCPVVAYDISYGPSEMIEPGVNGELVPAGDIEALGATIGRLIGDAATLERYSEAAYAWARAHDARRAAEYSAELFRGLLAQPAASTHA